MLRAAYSAPTQFIAELKRSAKNMIEEFRAALNSDWRNALDQDEWFFSRLEENIISKLVRVTHF
jgi:hypothetical protein